MKVQEKLSQMGINPETADFKDILKAIEPQHYVTVSKDEIEAILNRFENNQFECIALIDEIRDLLDKAPSVEQEPICDSYSLNIISKIRRILPIENHALMMNQLPDFIDSRIAKVSELEARIAEMEKALNPRLWDEKTNEAWCKNIPDLKKAFDAIREKTNESGV